MTGYYQSWTGENWPFKIHVPLVDAFATTANFRIRIRDCIQEWMRTRRSGIAVQIEENATISGWKNPSSISPEDFRSRLEDHAGFIGNAIGAQLQVEFPLIDATERVVARFMLIEWAGYPDPEMHTVREVSGYLYEYSEQHPDFDYRAEPITCVYGGWTDQDSTGTGSCCYYGGFVGRQRDQKAIG